MKNKVKGFKQNLLKRIMKIITITPDKNKALSILKMAELTIDMIKTIDVEKFATNITKEYYEVIRELISVIVLLDGFKIVGEKAHKAMIDYLEEGYKQFTKKEIMLINELRDLRNRIAYNGFFVKKEFISNKLQTINQIIKKLKEIIKLCLC